MARGKKSPLEAQKARAEIANIIGTFRSVLPMKLFALSNLVPGKLYELYALARLLIELRKRGWHVTFRGKQIEMPAGPGIIDPTRPHFELRQHSRGPVVFEIYTDIEVLTLGAHVTAVKDLSAYHEIDIVVVPKGTTGRPKVNAIALGIECKATANFDKAFVREVLGRRRELSFLTESLPCMLDGQVQVNANPPSEYWLVYIDPSGDNYRESPAAFSVMLKHWQP
jgi:hypothetical protein